MQLEQIYLIARKHLFCNKAREFIVLLYSTFDVHFKYSSTLRVKLLVKKYEPRYIFIVALWLAWGDEAIGIYTVNSAFNESVCLLSWRYCYVWSAQKLYAWTLARSKSVKEVLTLLCHRISFCPFSSSPFLAKKININCFINRFININRHINRFLCLLALTARWGVALQSEKSDLRFILRCPQLLIN